MTTWWRSPGGPEPRCLPNSGLIWRTGIHINILDYQLRGHLAGEKRLPIIYGSVGYDRLFLCHELDKIEVNFAKEKTRWSFVYSLKNGNGRLWMDRTLNYIFVMGNGVQWKMYQTSIINSDHLSLHGNVFMVRWLNGSSPEWPMSVECWWIRISVRIS